MLADDLAVLVPTRGRPQAVGELIQAWNDTDADAHLHFAVDDDDPALPDYLDAFHHAGCVHGWDYSIGPRLRLAGTLNYLVEDLCGFGAVGFFGDDHRPRTPNWDRRFAECLSGGAGIVYGNDLLVGAKFPTAVMMTVDIPRTLGYLCPPGFVHLNLDLVWRDWGQGMGRITYLDDVVIEHVHPAAGKASMDAGYTECNSTEQILADTRVYHHYVEDGGLAADLVKLKELL